MCVSDYVNIHVCYIHMFVHIHTSMYVIFMHIHMHTYIHCVSEKIAQTILSELCQISINFNNFWQVDDRIAEVLCHIIYIFHLTSLISPHYSVNHKSTKFAVSQKKL